MTAFAVDTNKLVYAEGVQRAPSDRSKTSRSQRLVMELAGAREGIVAPAQVFAKLHNVLRTRHRLVSGDLQDGFAWRGVVVTNPFGPSPDRRLPGAPGSR